MELHKYSKYVKGGTVLQTAIRHSLVWTPVQTSLSSKHLTIFCCHDNKPSHSIRITQIIHDGREILFPNHVHFKMRDSRKHMEVNSKHSVTNLRASCSEHLAPHSTLHLLHCCQQSCSWLVQQTGWGSPKHRVWGRYPYTQPMPFWASFAWFSVLVQQWEPPAMPTGPRQCLCNLVTWNSSLQSLLWCSTVTDHHTPKVQTSPAVLQ